jgi:hypothetical protein
VIADNLRHRMACKGADTVTNHDSCEEMAECIACEKRVRWDLTEHPFFGFRAACREWLGTP